MEQDRLRHVVVWNPGEHAAMNNAEILEAYKDFLCVEHANFLDAAIDLNPGETHRCKLVLSVLSD
jgi:glucose-6-phosphate 1-epimerase